VDKSTETQVNSSSQFPIYMIPLNNESNGSIVLLPLSYKEFKTKGDCYDNRQQRINT